MRSCPSSHALARTSAILVLLFPLASGGALTREAEPQASVILLASQQDPEQAQQLSQALQSHLADLRVRVSLSWTPELPPVFGQQLALARDAAARTRANLVLWCDPQALDALYVLVPDEGGGRLLYRAVDTESSRRDVRLEAMAFVARATVVELVQPATPASPPSAQPLGSHLELSLSYMASAHSSAVPLQHGARLGLGYAILDHLSLGAWVRLTPGLLARTERAAVAIDSFPLELGAQVPFDLGPLRIFAGVSAVPSYLGWEAYSRDPQIEEAHPGPVLELSAGTYLGLRWQLGPELALAGEIGCDALLLGADFTLVRADGSRDPLLTPWLLRPFARVGVVAGIPGT